MEKYISIKEFAYQIGVSPQAIYQRLDKDLKPFLKVIENKKKLSIEAFKLFALKGVEQPIDKAFDNQLVKTLQDTLKILSRQLETKDQQIADLNERLKEAQELNKNNQILLGSEQSRTNPALLVDNESLVHADGKEQKKGFLKRMLGK